VEREAEEEEEEAEAPVAGSQIHSRPSRQAILAIAPTICTAIDNQPRPQAQRSRCPSLSTDPPTWPSPPMGWPLPCALRMAITVTGRTAP
jgi:hypothetical protein